MGKKTVKKENSISIFRWLIIGALGLFFSISLWGIVEFFTTDHPDMEAYKCDNPNCGKIHYRQKSDSN
jgi:hypothetical protein